MSELTTQTYDSATISNAEIVAPSINKTEPQLEIRALREGMKMAETKDAIMSVTGGVTDINDSDAPMILRATAAILTAKRQFQNKQQSQTKDSRKSINDISIEDINKMNEEYYKN